MGEPEANRADQLRVIIPEPFASSFLPSLDAPVTMVVAPSLDDEAIAPLLGDADALISPRFSAAFTQKAGRLRLVQTVGAGTDNIDFSAIPPGTTVCNVYGHQVAIAEYVLMMMLALNRELVGMDQRLRQGDWRDHEYSRPQRELRGRTLAIVGLGHIGMEVARYARSFGMGVIAVTRSPDPARYADLDLAFLGGMGDLLAVLAEADFVTLALPLTPETTDLIGARELRAMKSSAYLINVARAKTANERALYRALADREIAGAALDVWYRDPSLDVPLLPAAEPFHTLPNIIMSSHVAGWTDGTVANRWATINENLRRLIAGETLLNIVREPARMAD